jgi:spermidine/putrescine-binding protein
MLGIIYNSEFVDKKDVAEESWGLLWNEKYAGKILQFNNPRDAFGTAMYWKDMDINSADPEVWDDALELLKAQKPLLQGYVNDEIFNKMKGASAYIAPYFAGDFLTMAAENEDLNFYYPKEGTNYFVDAMCIPVTSKNPDLAHEYIDFMISLEIARANALYIGYASPNKAVTDDPEYKKLLSQKLYEGTLFWKPSISRGDSVTEETLEGEYTHYHYNFKSGADAEKFKTTYNDWYNDYEREWYQPVPDWLEEITGMDYADEVFYDDLGNILACDFSLSYNSKGKFIGGTADVHIIYANYVKSVKN